MPTSGAGARAASSPESATGCGRRPRTAAFSLTPRPEILSADLSGLMLDCALWGVADACKLAFLDAPPRAALKEARALLTTIGAIDGDGRITDEGRAIASLALPPRLARMVVDAARAGQGGIASEIAVLLTERGLGGDSVDLATRIEAFRRDRSQRADDARRLARGLAARAEAFAPGGRGERALLPPAHSPVTTALTPHPSPGRGAGGPGRLLASAYPDRIAISRGRRGEFLMANGRAAALEAHDPLAGEPFIAIGEIAGRAASARILLAAALTLDDVERIAGASIETLDELSFDPASASLRARRRRRLSALTLAEQTLAVPQDEAAALMLARGVLSLGLARLPWTKALKQRRDRVMFLAQAGGRGVAGPVGRGAQPPILHGSRRSSSARRSSTRSAPMILRAPSTRCCPGISSGASMTKRRPISRRRREPQAPIDYEAEGGPAIALRVQELFGLNEHPSLAGGRIPLTLHLLSPANRLIQITRDLPGFWRGSWAAVRADLRGRYPRHFWPEDPAAAAPTARAKPRGT